MSHESLDQTAVRGSQSRFAAGACSVGKVYGPDSFCHVSSVDLFLQFADLAVESTVNRPRYGAFLVPDVNLMPTTRHVLVL